MKLIHTTAMALFAVSGVAAKVAAQVSGSVKVWEGNVLLTPGTASQAFTYNCQFPIWPLRQIPVIGGLNWSFSGNSNGQVSISAKAEFATTPEQIAQNALQESISQFLPDLPCTFGIEQDLGVFRGDFSLYSFAAGGGISGGFEVKRRALGSMTFVDYLDITSPAANTIELPIHVSGFVLAAESFGDPGRTKAIAKLRMSGSLGQEGFIEEVGVESVSTIPEEATINVTRVVRVNLNAGVTSVAIVLEGTAEAEATAVSAGFFGTISGSATAQVNFPNSIRIRPFRAVDGGPLPGGVTIRSRNLDRILQSSEAFCYANCDGSSATPILTANDFVCFLQGFAAGHPNANCDGSSHNPLLTANDFVCFVNRYTAGCS